ncbi:CaiB/BaiF CoA transferase family protein [Vannielia litorea]|uniref:CaiB/BaiF CoA transferase family protein n=1 Tax=Vannielia litorea TaxID=1217970 RepID=UPI001BCE6D27|nr:CaiB/BaiF CoA-transferase family protein [Vannielia litorea]MBS8224614.1 CoA transferase [Vannielia litorea]
MTTVPPQSGPLAGIRIVEFAGVGPGPFCAMLLADMGAEVITVDRVTAHGLGIKKEPRHNPTLRSRQSIRIDLKTSNGLATALRLVSQADALIEGNRPGVMERLGIGPAECLTANPALVYGRMTGWGQDGPMAQEVGHDLNYLALSGALSLLGPRDRPPTIPLNLLADLGGGGVYLALGILAALLDARTSGKGQVVDASMLDGIGSLMTHQFGYFGAGTWSDKREDNFLDGGAPWYNTYETSDGKFVAVGAIEPKFYRVLLEAMGIDPDEVPEAMDRASWPGLKKRFAEIFNQRSRAEWEAIMEGKPACFAPVLRPEEAVNHPHMQARGSYVDVQGITQPAPAPRFSRTPNAVRSAPPEPGANTYDVLNGWGFSAQEIEDLAASGAIA